LQTQSYFQLIGPLIFLAFSCGFAIIWRYARDSVPLRLFALAFFLGACATFADYMRGAMPPIAAFYATNVFYIATALVFVSALYHYYTQRIPWIFAAVMAVAVPAVLSWYILVDDDIVARIIVMNVCGAFIIAMPAVSLRAHMLRPIDRILQTALVVIGICVGARAGFVIVTGGGPGVMEAGNRGAADVGAPSIGLNIVLPHEQAPNEYVTPELSFNFHYFAIRKMHFLMRARALAVFPGGFGTCDELFETLTLIQTGKMKPIPVLLFGKEFWTRVIDFGALAREGTISQKDLDLITWCETADEAWAHISKFYDFEGPRVPEF